MTKKSYIRWIIEYIFITIIGRGVLLWLASRDIYPERWIENTIQQFVVFSLDEGGIWIMCGLFGLLVTLLFEVYGYKKLKVLLTKGGAMFNKSLGGGGGKGGNAKTTGKNSKAFGGPGGEGGGPGGGEGGAGGNAEASGDNSVAHGGEGGGAGKADGTGGRGGRSGLELYMEKMGQSLPDFMKTYGRGGDGASKGMPPQNGGDGLIVITYEPKKV